MLSVAILFIIVFAIILLKMPSYEEDVRQYQEHQRELKRKKAEERKPILLSEQNRIEYEINHYKPDWERFQTKLEEFDVYTLYHFTDRSNIPSIIANGGLLSWDYLEKNGVTVQKPNSSYRSRLKDKEAGLSNYVRLSLTRNNPMMYIARKENRITDPVVLEIDRLVLYQKGTKFSNINATTAKNIDDSFECFDSFKLSVLTKHYLGLDVSDKKFYLAELLVLQKIPLRFIKNIYSIKY